MTESEIRKILRQMKEQDSQTAFRNFYNMTYDRLFRIAYYYVKRDEWSQEIVLDVFLKLWQQRSTLPDVRSIEDYCFILVKNASLNFLKKESRLVATGSDSMPEPQEQSDSPEESLINADSLTNVLYLNLTGKEHSTDIANATVEVRVDGQLRETLRPATSNLEISVRLSRQNECLLDKTYSTEWKQNKRKQSFGDSPSVNAACLDDMTESLSMATKEIVEEISREMHLILSLQPKYRR